MQRSLILAAVLAALPCSVLANGPADTARPHPAVGAHATAVAGQAAAARIEACARVASTLVDSLAKGDFKAATADFDATMTSGLGADKLAAVWQQVDQQFGKLEGRGTLQNAMYQGDVVVVLPLRFAKGNVSAQVACDADGKIAGFFLRPAATTTPAAASSAH